MEYLEGAISAEQSVKSKGPFPWTDAMKILVAVTEALALCHKRKVVHRDLKPDNVMLLPDGRVKLIDLGAADFGPRPIGEADVFQGTLRYAAPEAVLRRPLGPSSDLYSLAVTFHDLVMGMTHDQVGLADPLTFPDEARENLRSRGVGRSLRDILHRCLDPNPAKRFPDAVALREALSKLPFGTSLPAAPQDRSVAVSDESQIEKAPAA
jgi:serine/threonine-protein kinase